MAKSQIFYGILTTFYVLWNPDHRLDDAVQSVLEYPVGLPDVFEWEPVGYERCSVDFAVGDEMQYGVAVAAVDPAGLECEVFAVHFRQGENLGASYIATMVTMALGLAHSHAILNVSSLPAASITRSAPPWEL